MSKIFKHLNNLETEFKKKKRVLGGTILKFLRESKRNFK